MTRRKRPAASADFAQVSGLSQPQNLRKAPKIDLLPSKQRVVGSNPSRDARRLTRATAFPSEHYVAQSYSSIPSPSVACQGEEEKLATLSDALITNRICAKAEGKSPRTVFSGSLVQSAILLTFWVTYRQKWLVSRLMT